MTVEIREPITKEGKQAEQASSSSDEEQDAQQLDTSEAFQRARQINPSDKVLPVQLISGKFSCRMYENQFPEVNDLVMVTVQQVAEMGAYVTLLEYNNIEGMVLLSELSRRRIRSVQRLVRVGKNEVVIVLRVDKEKGYIDLSKRRVSPEDVEKFEDKFNKSKTVHSIMRHVAEKLDIELEDLYRRVGWPLYKKFGHAYDAFKLAINDPELLWTSIEEPIEESIRKELSLNIVRRLTPQKIKLRSDFEVVCFGYEGIDAVKAALKEGESVSTDEMPIKIRLVAPPLYVMQTSSYDKAQAIEVMNQALEKIEKSILSRSQGQMAIKMKPKAVSESDDRDLDDLMKKSERENAEVSGDEDASD
jgi:translation initiation factor 2 subunit 1